MNDKNLGMTHKFVEATMPGLPTLLLLHGTGGNESDLLDLGHMLLPGAALLSPRGNVTENGMPRFFRRLAEGVFDLKDLAERTVELGNFVAAGATEYGFDPKSVAAVGFSNGANIAASLLLTSPQILASAVLLHPMVPFVPTSAVDLSGKSIFVSAGKSDPMVPAANTQQLVDILTHSGAAVEISWQPGGHALTRSEAEAASDWCTRHLAPAAH